MRATATATATARRAVGLSLLLMVMGSRPGAAVGPGRGAPSVAVVVVAGLLRAEKQEAARLEQAVRGSLLSSGFSTIWAPAHDPAADLRVEIDLSDHLRPVLTLVPRLGTAVTRPVTLTHGLDDVGCEALAQIIESAASSLLAQRRPEPPPPSSAPPPAAATAPGTAPPSRSPLAPPGARTDVATRATTSEAGTARTGAALEVFYAVSSVGAGSTLIQGPGVAVSAAPYGGRLVLSASYALPATFHGNVAGYTLSGLTMRFGGAMASWGQPTWLEIDSRFGIDLLWVAASSEIGPGLKPAADHLSVGPTVGLSATVGSHVGRWATIRVSALLDVEYLSFKIHGSNDPHAFFQPWSYRPGVALGLRWR